MNLVNGKNVLWAVVASLVFLVLFIDPAGVFAQGISQVGGWHYGTPRAAFINDDVAVISSGAFVRFFLPDVVNSPQEIAEMEMPGVVQGLEIVGDTLYAVGYGGFGLVDVTDPSNPVFISGVELPVDGEHEMCISGDLVFISTYEGSLTIFSVANPALPVVLATIETPDTDLQGIASYGDYVYLGSDDDERVMIFSVADPASPAFVAGVDLDEYVETDGLKILGDFLYVFSDYEEYYILDLVDPSAPVLVATFEIGEFRAADFDDNLLFVAHDGSGGMIEVFDCAIPAAPVAIDTLVVDAVEETVDLSMGSGSGVFCTGDDGGFLGVFVELPPLGKLEPESWPLEFEDRVEEIGIWQDLVITCGELDHASFFDVSNPESITRYTKLDLPRRAYDLDVKDDMAAFACADSGIILVDLSTPGTYSVRDHITMSGSQACYDVCLAGDYLLAGLPGNGAVFVYDISVPGAATLVSSEITSGSNRGSLVYDHTWLRLSWNSLIAVDISDPSDTQPPEQLLSSQPFYPMNGAILGDYLCVAEGTQGLAVISMYDEGDPITINRYLGEFSLQDIAVMDDRIYLADRDQGLIVLDGSDMALPSILWENDDHFARTNGVAISAGRKIARANTDLGFTLFEDSEVVASYLAGLSVIRQAGEAVISWHLGDPFQTGQFNVWRGTEAGPQERATETTLTGAGNFRWVDPEAPSGSVVYWLEEVKEEGATWLGSVTLRASELPMRAEVSTPWPNPFNPLVNFRVELSLPAELKVDIYDLRGHWVTSLNDGPVAAGQTVFTWSGRDDQGRAMDSGVYLARVVGAGLVESRKLVLVR